MTYLDIVRDSPKGDESIMWVSIEMISDHIEELERVHPEKAKKLKNSLYELMNGKHFNEKTAKDAVSKMYSKNEKGEMMSAEEVRRYHPDEETSWDAYVGYNAIMHDLYIMGFDKDTIAKIAENFWFKDDDFPTKEKTWWYMSNK